LSSSIASSPQRAIFLDTAKGIAIIAIVLGHVLRGLASAGLLETASPMYIGTDRFLYLFHLAVFTFITGLFVASGAQKTNRWAYLRKRDLTFLYLYLLWGILQGLVKVATSSEVNSPKSLGQVLEIWRPEGQLWYLPFLMLATILAVLLQPWKSRLRQVVVLLSIAIVGLVFWGISGSYALTQGLGLLVFYFSGVAIGAQRFVGFSTRFAPLGLIILAAVTGVAFIAISQIQLVTPPAMGGDSSPRTFLSVLWGMLGSVCGLVCVLAISLLLSRLRNWFSWLAFLGTRSLEIYLAHVMAGAGARVLLVKLGVHDSLLIVVVCTFVGIGLPILLWWLCRLVRFPWLFTAPPAIVGK
jgi:fucose 4-O-acetylase-like acetyltransferase